MSEMPSAGGGGYEPPRNPNQIAGVDKKWWIIGGVAAVGVVYYAYKRSNASSVSAGDAANAGYSAAGGGIAGGGSGLIDPNTGYTYASEYGAPYPQNAIDPTTGIPYSLEGPIDPTTGIPYSVEGQTPPPTPTPTPPPPDLPGQDWLSAAVKALTAHGVTDAHARQVLAEYLSGIPLTHADLGIVEQAIGLVGAAPGNPTVHTVPTPTNHPGGGSRNPKPKPPKPPVGHHPKPPPVHHPKVPVPVKHPKPPATHKYKVKAGDTLSAIARRFHLSLKQIEKLNPKIKNPNVIHPGEEIIV